MTMFLLAYLAGALTILSPCILPVLPFVFARAGQPFMRSGLPMLFGMATTFALVATLAAVGGGWIVQANQYGRLGAVLLLGVFGLTLLFPALSDYMTRPLVALGNRLSASAQSAPGNPQPESVLPSLLLGVATGLLWAPCAGPILGIVLTGAALGGASQQTSGLLLAYALGAASSLAAALLIGGRVFAAMKKSFGIGEWIRRGLGVAVLLGVTTIAMGWDTGLLVRLSLANTGRLEQSLLGQLRPSAMTGGVMMTSLKPEAGAPISLPVEGTLPALDGAVQWLNSPPLTRDALRGKVVLIDFWTYSCINCLRTLPYVNAWAKKYHDQGLVVIGVHAPEFAFEKDIGNVTRAVRDLGIAYPVAIDNNYAIWGAFNNQYWPAHYFVDAQGRIRHHHFGEGDYEESERIIQQLLAEAGHKKLAGDAGLVKAAASGISLASADDVQSPETYVGYARAANFASVGGAAIHDQAHDYLAPKALSLNEWALQGNWRIEDEKAVLTKAGGHLSFRFHARDLHLVMGPGATGKPIRFRVRLNGQVPGASHGVDVDANGEGSVTGQRLYQLVRQAGAVQESTFDIEFLDPDAETFSFTFG